IKRKRQLFAQIGKLAQYIGEGLHGSRAKSIRSFLERSEPTFLIDRIPNVFIYPNPPMNKGKDPSREFLNLWGQVHQGLRELVELDAAVFYNPYILLLERIAYFFQDISKKDDVLFLEELNHKARGLFGEGGITVAEIYYRLATRFHQYLIDEFQDTSILQWQNLSPMIQEALSCGGSLFYVGDTKQAIYRFRGGEAELFSHVGHELSSYNVRNDVLSKNWRSQRAIIEFNNRVFSRENLAHAITLDEITEKFSNVSEECRHILDVFSDAQQSWREDHQFGYVYVERLAEEDTQKRENLMRTKTLQLLAQLVERFSYQDIAILARGNDEVELVTSWLLEAGIPVESEKTLNVLENSLIKEVIAFLRFLHSPPDDLSFAAFILGDIACRASGISRQVITDFIFTLRTEKKLGVSPLYRYFRERWPGAWDSLIDEFFRSVGFLSHYELTTAFFERFSVYESFSDTQAFFMKFLELIKATEEDHVDLGGFLSYCASARDDELYVSVAGASAVRVITIHKAKGLEFDVVIVPFLRMEVNPETAGKGTSSYVSPEDFRLVRITERHRYFSQRLRDIYSYNYRKACIDELNAIYVALTRPRYELYIFVPAIASGNEKNKARFLIPEDITEIGAKRTYSDSARPTQASVVISPSRYKDWAAAIRDEFGDASSIRNRKKILEGNVVHAILSRIGNCLGCEVIELIAGALGYAQGEFPGENIAGYRQTIQDLIRAPALYDFFFLEAGEVFCEKEFVDATGNLRRIDRLIVRTDEVIVVDFKTSGEITENARVQVQHYIRMMGDIYPGRGVRGYLVYVESKEAIEVH
ncbi:MAG: UvrD-helicase domain-containing protein, partial [Candidatus Omnitrophica bacterium]|nr:UvrD-helicase domain-containing protein [Candidatus Omnitrophota bacterium]